MWFTVFLYLSTAEAVKVNDNSNNVKPRVPYSELGKRVIIHGLPKTCKNFRTLARLVKPRLREICETSDEIYFQILHEQPKKMQTKRKQHLVPSCFETPVPSTVTPAANILPPFPAPIFNTVPGGKFIIQRKKMFLWKLHLFLFVLMIFLLCDLLFL